MKTIMFLLALSSLCCACSSISTQPISAEQWAQQADAIRAQARAQFEQGHSRTALAIIKKALRISSKLTLSSISLVEIYDDAGLYFYMNKQWRAAARHQTIAVLLACNQAESAAFFAEYVHRLGLAFAKYSPQQPFRAVADNPLWLLSDPDLALYKNNDIRRRFFTPYLVFRDNMVGHELAFKLNLETLPHSCYFHTT
jgi:tetratricopeptide (TPR) repeat protein